MRKLVGGGCVFLMTDFLNMLRTTQRAMNKNKNQRQNETLRAPLGKRKKKKKKKRGEGRVEGSGVLAAV